MRLSVAFQSEVPPTSFGKAASTPTPVAPESTAQVALPEKSAVDTAWRTLPAAIRRGDEAAFGRFYDLYGFRLYKWVLVLVRGNELEAREVLQAILIKLARGIPDFDREPVLWAWLCTLSRNAFLDHCRSRLRHQRHRPLDDQAAELRDASDPGRQLCDSLEEAMTDLSPEERELIQAAYVDRRNLGELAAEHGQSYKAMESRLARLRLRLKNRLLKQL